jgi:hypothetical protein
MAAGAATLAWSSASRADETGGSKQPAPTFVMPDEEPGYTGPNRTLLATGFFAFAGAYVPSVIVAAGSPRPVDQRLDIPVAGPWIDLAERPGCSESHLPCGLEAGNRALLVASGAFQGAGALLMFASFAFPERDGYVTTAKRDKRDEAVEKEAAQRALAPTLHFAAAPFGAAGYGALAFGDF